MKKLMEAFGMFVLCAAACIGIVGLGHVIRAAERPVVRIGDIISREGDNQFVYRPDGKYLRVYCTDENVITNDGFLYEYVVGTVSPTTNKQGYSGQPRFKAVAIVARDQWPDPAGTVEFKSSTSSYFAGVTKPEELGMAILMPDKSLEWYDITSEQFAAAQIGKPFPKTGDKPPRLIRIDLKTNQTRQLLFEKSYPELK